MKIAVIADLAGQFERLIQFQKENYKKTQVVLCLGNFFQFQSNLDKILLLQFKIPTYFTDTGPLGLPLSYLFPEGKEFCKNLTFLGRSGLKQIQGLKVAYLSGKLCEQIMNNQKELKFSNIYYNKYDVKKLQRESSGSRTIDIFLLNQLERQLQKFQQIFRKSKFIIDKNICIGRANDCFKTIKINPFDKGLANNIQVFSNKNNFQSTDFLLQIRIQLFGCPFIKIANKQGLKLSPLQALKVNRLLNSLSQEFKWIFAVQLNLKGEIQTYVLIINHYQQVNKRVQEINKFKEVNFQQLYNQQKEQIYLKIFQEKGNTRILAKEMQDQKALICSIFRFQQHFKSDLQITLRLQSLVQRLLVEAQ